MLSNDRSCRSPGEIALLQINDRPVTASWTTGIVAGVDVDRKDSSPHDQRTDDDGYEGEDGGRGRSALIDIYIAAVRA